MELYQRSKQRSKRVEKKAVAQIPPPDKPESQIAEPPDIDLKVESSV
jgi:hypothetical protein